MKMYGRMLAGKLVYVIRPFVFVIMLTEVRLQPSHRDWEIEDLSFFKKTQTTLLL